MPTSNQGEEVFVRIHSTESFGTVDGPGIRFIVFFQGCPLRCLYCHNRDTWDRKAGKNVSIGALIDQIKSYEEFLRPSGGGVTASGGEPLLQPEGLNVLFGRVRSLGLTTVLDTSGAVALSSEVKGVLDKTDLVLLDLKHIREEGHRRITGVGRKNPSAFLTYLDEKKIPVWIRYVVVPGYTDDPEEVAEAAEWLSGFRSIRRIDVLPYHTMGRLKWENLGVDYPLGDTPSPDPEQLAEIRRILGGSGIKVV